MTSIRTGWFFDVGGQVNIFEVGWCIEKCLQGWLTSRESATESMSLPAGTATANLEGYRVEHDIFRDVFGSGWSRDLT